MQQFDIEIKYKPASEMCVAGALSRNPIFPSRLDSSPEEEDPYFTFVEEKVQPKKLPNGKNLESLFDNPVESNFIKTINVEYDANTEDDWQKLMHRYANAADQLKHYRLRTQKSL